ncbi:MAG: hypothetical protein ACI83H_002153 [Glaciecola sp.]|jgi:hypothetical protein
MKNKIENLSVFLVLGLSLFAMVKVLMFAINFVSNLDIQTNAMAFGG